MKRIILVYLVFFVFTSFMPLNAQWAKVYGMNLSTEFEYRVSSIHQTNDGGYIIAGGVNNEIWILKLDSTGGIEWQRAYGEDGSYNCAYSIQQTSDGGYIVAGSGFRILKLDSTGNIEWQRDYGGGSSESADSIQQTSDGGFIAVGETWSFDNGYSDILVLKLDSIGNIDWQKTYGDSSSDCAHSIQQTSDGGFIAVGETNSFSNGMHDILVLKLDSMGDIDWQKIYGGGSSESADSIQQTSDGGFIVGGRTSSFGSGNVWVLKLDSMGDIDWQKTYGGSSSEFARSIQQTSDGGFIVFGGTSSFGNGLMDFWALKINPAGGIEWQRTYGRCASEYGSVAQQISEGGYIAVGKLIFNVPKQYSDIEGGTYWSVEGLDAMLLLKISPNGDIDPSCKLIGSSNASVSDTDVAPYEINIIPQDIDSTPLDTNFVLHDTDADVNRFWPDPTIFELSISSTSGGDTEPAEYSYYTFVSGTDISIKAVPESLFIFNGWTGDVPTGHGEDNPIIITMDSDKSVTAVFTQIPGNRNEDVGDGDGGGCFISTAAYGSPLHPCVKILRDFRDKYLMHNKIGRKLVNIYYKHSPFVANLIAKQKALKVFARINFLPIIVFSCSMVHIGPVITLFMFFFIFVFPIFSIWLSRRKSRRVKNSNFHIR